MRRITIDPDRCDGCEDCVPSCPFSALALDNGIMALTANCRYCRKCIPACQHHAIVYHAQTMDDAAKQAYHGILVVAEIEEGQLSRDSLELVQWAKALSETRQEALTLVAMSDWIDPHTLMGLPLVKAILFEDACYLTGDPQCAGIAVKKVIEDGHYNVVLFAATAQGKSIAPWVATQLKTGLTADCTALRMRRNGDVIQIRPAFGGEVMARIVTPRSRPQMVTVRPRMIAPFQVETPKSILSSTSMSTSLPIIERLSPPARSAWHVLHRHGVGQARSLATAKVLVVAGRGVNGPAGVARVKAFAVQMNAAFGCTRALVELGWCERESQIGLSGLAVEADIAITLGVSGTVQFLAGIVQVKQVLAVNTDPNAPIFKRADKAACMDVDTFLSLATKLSLAITPSNVHITVE